MSNEENSQSGLWNVPVFRPELAFPMLSEEMVDRVRSYGREEILPANYALFRHGERQVDMFYRARWGGKHFSAGRGWPKKDHRSASQV